MVYVLILIFMVFLDWKFSIGTVIISPLVILAIFLSATPIADKNATVEIVDTREFVNGDFVKGSSSSATSSSKFSCVTSNGLEEILVGQATFEKSDENIIVEQKLKRKVFYKVFFLKFDKTHYIVKIEK